MPHGANGDLPYGHTGKSSTMPHFNLIVSSRLQEEIFCLLRKYEMKLNPSKCAFGVSADKFLGFMVTQKGI